MPIKPLPPKTQRKGRKISMIVTIVLGIIFGVSVGSFIGLSASMKQDQFINTGNTSATSLKDVNDGYIYSTNDNKIVYNDYSSKTLQTIDISQEIDPTLVQGNLNSISSLSYAPNSSTLYVTLAYIDSVTTKNYSYLFRFNKSNEGFILDKTAKLASIQNPITAFVENGDYLYTVIRSGERSTINRFNRNDLSLETDSGYLYRATIIFDEEGAKPESTLYTLQSSAVIETMYYLNNTIYLVTDAGVVGVKDGCFKNYPLSLDGSIVPFNEATYADYIFYTFTKKIVPHGAVNVDNKCFIVTDSKTLVKFSFSDLSKEIPVDEEYPEVREVSASDITLSEAAPTKRNGFFYSASAKYGAIITESGSSITYLNMKDTNNISIEFIDVAEININDVVINKEGSKIFYLCKNNVSSGSTLMMLKVKTVSDVMINIEIGKFTPALFVTALVSILLFLIALLCWIKPMFLEKFIDFLKNFRQNWVVYLILILTLGLLGMFCYYPAVGSISMSFFRYENNMPIVWNNFDNYVKVFTDPAMWSSFGNMVIFLIADIITAIIPPLIFAFFLSVMKGKKFSAVTRTLLFLPSVIPGITKMMIWQNGIYGDNGVINFFVKLCNGQPISFFNGSNFDIGWLILMGFPYVGSYLVFYGAMMNMPPSYNEAAELEGLNVWKKFFKIDIPLIQPQIKYVVILTIIASVQNFGRTYMINSSLFTVRTPIHIMYDYINSGNYGVSSAIAAVLFVLLLAATVFNFKKQKTQLGDSI